MVDRGIFKAYRKMNELGLNRKESERIFYSTISCFDKIFDNYYHLNEALENNFASNLSKEELSEKIIDGARRIKKASRLKAPFDFNEQNLF